MPNAKTATLNPALGAFARAAIEQLAAEGWTFVSLVSGIVTIEHPTFGRLDFDNDNYAAARVTHNWREGFYADALFSLETSNDDGAFERTIGDELGTDAATIVPVYDRHAAYRFDPLDSDTPEMLTPSELAALGDADRTDFDDADAIADVLAGTATIEDDDENDGEQSATDETDE
jgi:hypothetical protein